LSAPVRPDGSIKAGAIALTLIPSGKRPSRNLGQPGKRIFGQCVAQEIWIGAASLASAGSRPAHHPSTMAPGQLIDQERRRRERSPPCGIEFNRTNALQTVRREPGKRY
jgi:hypothetical protein